MSIAGEHANFPSWVADWPHCCDFEGDTCDDFDASRRVKIAAKCSISSHCVARPYPRISRCLDRGSRLDWGICDDNKLPVIEKIYLHK